MTWHLADMGQHYDVIIESANGIAQPHNCPPPTPPNLGLTHTA